MLIISQNDNSEELKKLKFDTNFNVLQYGDIPIGVCFSYKRKIYIKGMETAVCLEDGRNDEKFFADTKVFPTDAIILTD
jgi:hypothetical protein